MEANEAKKEEQGERKNIRGGVILAYIRFVILLIVGILYPPYLLEMVQSTNNGLYQFAGSIIQYTLLLSLGIENSYIRFATVYEKKDGEEGLRKINGFYLICYGFIACLELVVGLTVAGLYGFGAIANGNDPATNQTLGWLFLIISLMSSLDFFMSLFSTFAFYKSKFIWEQSVYLAIHLITTGLCALFLYLGKDIITVAIITAVIQLLFDGVRFIYDWKHLHMRFTKPTKIEFKSLFKEVVVFTIFLFMAIVVTQINANLGKTVLGYVGAFTLVTVYSYGLQFYTYENQISTTIGSNFGPKVNRLAIEGKNEEIAELFIKISEIQLIILFLMVGGFAACGQDFIFAWLGGKNNGLSVDNLNEIFYLTLALLALWIIPMAESLGIEVQKSYNKHKFLAIVNLVLALLSIGVTALCVHFMPGDSKVYGPFIGTALVVVVGMIIVSNIYYQKEFHLPILRFFKHFLIVAALAVVGWAVVYCLFRFGVHLPDSLNKWLVVLIKGALFVVIYLPLVFAVYHQQIKSFVKAHKSSKEGEEHA